MQSQELTYQNTVELHQLRRRLEQMEKALEQEQRDHAETDRTLDAAMACAARQRERINRAETLLRIESARYSEVRAELEALRANAPRTLAARARQRAMHAAKQSVSAESTRDACSAGNAVTDATDALESACEHTDTIERLFYGEA